MSTYTDLKCWFDTGYTDGSSEIPPVGHVLGTPDLTFAGPFIPSKDRLFTELQLPEEFTDLLNVSYIQLTLNLNNGLSTTTLFGWVDDVILHSDSTGKPMTTLKWHVDMWRTFNGSAEFGSGFVQRKPSGNDDFFQNYPHNYIKTKMQLWSLEQTNGGHWVVIAYDKQTGTAPNVVSQLQYYTFPIASQIITAHTATPPTLPTCSWKEVFSSQLDEKLSLDPERIIGSWVVPFCPFPDEFTFNAGTNTWDFAGINWTGTVNTGGTIGYFYMDAFSTSTPVQHSVSFALPLKAEEVNPIYITGFQGEKVGEIPYKMTVNSMKWHINLSATSVTLEMRFDGLFGALEGLTYVIPFPSIDINSNTWSSYVMSGQREYDKTMRAQRSEQSAVEGAIGGTATGAMYGAAFGMSIGSVPGAAVGAIAGGIGSIVNGGLDMAVYNDRFQAAEDQYHARQTGPLLSSGQGVYMSILGSCPTMQQMEFDLTSQNTVDDIKSVQGVKFNAPYADCGTLIATGGPMQISNLIVKGNIPTVAKKWIKQKFADGVRIVSR